MGSYYSTSTMTMSEPYFATPANIRDYKDPANYWRWSHYISQTIDDVIALEEKTVGKGNCQFYNPVTTRTPDKPAVKKVTWNGFPKRLLTVPNYYEVADRKGGWIGDEVERNQDEYLEWYVYKNDGGKITRIDFTCEAREYWQHLFDWEPGTCLELYKEHVSPDVRMEDLYTVEQGKKTYNSHNKWNTTLGCMHLNCKPNSLEAEIQLGGDATIIRERDGKILTDAQALINCSRFGRADRNSDPHIGDACNSLCRQGLRLTLADPVCLFIASVSLSGWSTPDGRDASQYMRLTRGTKEKGLRYSLQVPATEGFTVGDITIGGQPLQYGGMVAALTDVGLLAQACPNPAGAQPAHSCVPPKPVVAAHGLGTAQPGEVRPCRAGYATA